MQHRRFDRSGFTLIELMIVVAILGILAVVAIPAFVRYMRNAKTAEAYRMVNKIAKGIQLYFSTPHYASNGQRVPCMLPNAADTIYSDGFTPPVGYCCVDGEADGKCEPNETHWDEPSWKQILFKISDKHYYSYSSGHDGPVQETAVNGWAIAEGDLDCDGTYSTIANLIHASKRDNIHNCRTYKAANFIVLNETE